MSDAGDRIQAFDWLRGLAVLVMIQTHCNILLTPAIQKTAAYAQLVAIDGLVAPSFIFSAGFALALVQVRAAAKGRGKDRLRKNLKRIGEVLLVASLINAVWFPVFSEPWWLLRIDILHCIGLSLLLLLPVLGALGERPRVLRWVTLGLALLVFGLSPLGEQVRGPLQLFLNTEPGILDATTGASFPLLPWAGYIFLGASFGATVGTMKSERELWAWLGLLLGLGAVLWWQGKAIESLYPPHHFWVTNPANAAHRWFRVLSLVALLRLLEWKWPKVATLRLFTWLGSFGAASLSAYFFHEMLLFHWRIGWISKIFRDRAEWPTFWVLVAILITTTWWAVELWTAAEPWVRAQGARLTSWAARPRSAS